MIVSIIHLFSRRANKLDLSSQKVLFDQYYKLVYRTAYWYCADHEAVQDIVQETFIRAFKYFDSYIKQEDIGFEAWLLTITKNESIKYIQKKMKLNEMFGEDLIIENKAVNNSVEDQILAQLTVDEIQKAISELPVLPRTIFLLRIIHEYTFKEIGNELGINENNARQHFFRAKKN